MRLLCKKKYKIDFYFKTPECLFVKNKWYYGERVKFKAITPTSKVPHIQDIEVDIMEIKTDDGRRIKFEVDKDPLNFKQFPHYKEYFYTEAEVRKMKLKRMESPLNKILKLFK